MWFCYVPQIAFLCLKTLVLMLLLVIWHSFHLDISDFLIFLAFAYLINLLVINTVDSSFKKSSSQAAVGMKSSGLCCPTLIAGIGKICKFWCIPLFLYKFIVLASKRKNQHVWLLGGYTS